MAALGPVREVYGDFRQAEAALDGLDGQFSLNLKAAAEERQAFHELAAEGAVTREDVGQLDAEDEVERRAHEAVRHAVAPLELTLRLRVQARADAHVNLARDDGRQQRVDGLGGVGVVAVHHHIEVRVHLPEHRLDDVAFPLPPLREDDGARAFGPLAGAVGRVVVEDVDARVGQLLTEALDDVRDGRLLVVAGGAGWGAPAAPRCARGPPRPSLLPRWRPPWASLPVFCGGGRCVPSLAPPVSAGTPGGGSPSSS